MLTPRAVILCIACASVRMMFVYRAATVEIQVMRRDAMNPAGGVASPSLYCTKYFEVVTVRQRIHGPTLTARKQASRNKTRYDNKYADTAVAVFVAKSSRSTETATITATITITIALPWQAVADAATSRRAPILVTGNNVEVTEPLKEYVEKKMANVLDKVSHMSGNVHQTFVRGRHGVCLLCAFMCRGGVGVSSLCPLRV